ncbi:MULTISPECIES: Holliday junction branch migration DNA helicase RuvB [unclassified Thermosipho (in: thermotogales)]|uniref:Holliday junction branch migration DNA helicase RuvB n=1 Tax=unclassified Thermosipho (in: thermotogales) TaxID=2676525 RepID=UPI0009C5F1A8|nr:MULTISPECIES: Holliday junction branch migration DNA helicase RuvB [unclassified Thermosipho (in: thermotogales)]MBT1247945.1 ATP-dependent DNA helicase RuvB [Thermosipho sp. 1244]OOC46130.1 ATP-dependent DNA helicase RuvB [Thermosipho sp. 1223]
MPNDVQTIRPQKLNEYIGQENIKKRLGLAIKASKMRSEALDHVLLVGPPGLGKTTLAHIISNELGTNIHVTSGPILEKQGDVAAILTNLEYSDVLFIDEIHRMNKSVEEILYTAMEDFQIDILIGKGPSARSIRIDLQPFTLVGATTRSGLLSAPLRNRFGLIMELDFYSIEELSKIIERAASVLNVEINKDAAILLARRSRGTPRIALRLLRRVRDMSTIRGKVTIDMHMVEEIMELLGIDEEGLDELDRRILKTIIEVYNGGPVGVKSLAASVGISEDSISEVYEPYLLQSGFIARTHRGRIATQKAYKHLGINVKRGLFDE